MGIKFRCPNGHKLNVKSFLAGKKGICPHCGTSVRIPEATAQATEDQGAETEIETELQTGGTATATLTKSIAESISASSTITTPTATVSTAVTPVSVAPVMVQPVTPIATTQASPMAASPAIASAAPLITPVATATPVVASVPVAVAAPLGSPVVAAPLAPSPYAIMPTAPVDPITEAPNAVWYVRPPSGGQFGPARGDIMRKWLGEGRVSADSLVWRDGWQDWKSAVVVFPSLAPASSPAGLSAPGETLGIAAPAKGSVSRKLSSKKRSNTVAIAMVTTLGLVAVVLLLVFIYVISTMNQ